MELEDFVRRRERLTKEIERGLTEFTSFLTNEISKDEWHKALSEPVQVKKEQVEKQVHLNVLTLKKRIENGTYHLLQALFELSSKQPELFSDQVAQDLARLIAFTSAENMQKSAQKYLLSLDHDESLQKVCKISESSLNSLYQAAKHLYEDAMYEDAADAFCVLTFVNAKQSGFWMGLGHSEFFCNRYSPALLAYALACQTNTSDPYCHFFSCKCYIALNELENALNALDVALFIIGENKDYGQLKQQITHERQRVLQKMKKSEE